MMMLLLHHDVVLPNPPAAIEEKGAEKDGKGEKTEGGYPSGKENLIFSQDSVQAIRQMVKKLGRMEEED